MQLKNTIAPVLVSSLGMVGSLGAQDLTGAYGSFSEAALKSAALESLGLDLGDDELQEGKMLDYFKFGVNVRAEYNDNIFLTDTNEVNDVILRVSVPLELSSPNESVNEWSIGYTPRFNFYADNSSEDGIDHFVNAGYNRQWAKTSLDFGFGYSKTRGSNRFASGSIERDGYNANLSLSHILTGKSRLDFDLGGLVDDYVDPRLFDRNRYNTRLAWQYQVTGKTTVGPYIAYEGVNVQSNPDHNAVSGGIKGTYQALQKTVVTGYVGAEYRKFDGGALNSKTSPSFEVGATHQFSGKTSFSGMLYHTIRASYSDFGQSYKATGVNFLARYAYSSRINMRAGVSYEYDDYFAVSALSGPDFDDHYITFFLGGDYAMDNGLILGSGVRLSRKDSSQDPRDFDNFIFNVDARYSF
ncbi:hypothetical protein [Rubritalea tangerina]|uniref:Porin n=1 Tax=Rubritalea tangerina TaxID=430798 RepID=A0ABW4ZAG2_9BACT